MPFWVSKDGKPVMMFLDSIKQTDVLVTTQV